MPPVQVDCDPALPEHRVEEREDVRGRADREDVAVRDPHVEPGDRLLERERVDERVEERVGRHEEQVQTPTPACDRLEHLADGVAAEQEGEDPERDRPWRDPAERLQADAPRSRGRCTYGAACQRPTAIGVPDAAAARQASAIRTAQAPSSTVTGGASPSRINRANDRSASRTVGDGSPTGRDVRSSPRTVQANPWTWSPTSWPPPQATSIRPVRPAEARDPVTVTIASLPSSSSVARKVSSVRRVTARAVRHQTRVTSRPVRQRTRSKPWTPVWRTMPPPAVSGSSSQASGEGSNRWLR